MSSFVEGKPEIFLATVAERFPHSAPLLATFKKFSDQKTHRAQVQISSWAEDLPNFALIARPKDSKVSDLVIRLLPDLMGPNMEMLVEDPLQPLNQTRLKLQLGWDTIGSPDRKDGGWKKDFITSLELPSLSILSEQGEWLLRVSRYFIRTSKQYINETNPQTRVQTLEELDEEFDGSPRRLLAALEERGFVNFPVAASI